MSLADLELAFYEKFFLEPGLEPYAVQEEAITRIFAGESVLVTVPTGTGKTLMAKAGIARALGLNQRAIYTTPLRALTEEKYRELVEDFGPEKVGFATGDYKVNPEAPVQVLVAEILWNRIYGDQNVAPADIVIIDEGHYFNDLERGYVWEQSIIGLHPASQLVILSATVGFAQAFCHWVHLTRGVEMKLVESHARRVPLFHRFREDYLIEVVKELYANGEYPAIIFNFSRAQCFERARLLRSCPRFTTPEEQRAIAERADPVLLPTGLGPDLRRLLEHGIGVHHAGVLPAYRRLVEELTGQRLLKFVVTTETIAAGINLPAKRVVFPSLRKFIRGKARLLFPAEYHQMAGRAGRPQFDTEGVAITLAPEEVVQEFRKEIRDLRKRGVLVDETKIKKKYYARAKADARAREDVTWDEEVFQKLVEGQPAGLVSRTQITPEQVLAIGLPDIAEKTLPGQALIDDRKRNGASTVETGDAYGAPSGAAPTSVSGRTPQTDLGAAVTAASSGTPQSGPGAAVNGAAGATPQAGLGALPGSLADVKVFAGLEAIPEMLADVKGHVGLGPAPGSERLGTPEAAGRSRSGRGGGWAGPEASSLGDDGAFRTPEVGTEVSPVMAPGAARSGRLDITTVIDHLLLPGDRRREAHKRLAMITRNLQALEVLDGHGRQVRGEMVGRMRGVDGVFVHFCLTEHALDTPGLRALVEYLVDHDAIQRIHDRRVLAKAKDWIRERLRELRRENPQVTFEDVEAEYWQTHPRELAPIELIHQAFVARIPHPELHGGKVFKSIWATIDDEALAFMDYVERHDLSEEEGQLFTYLARVMNTARMLAEVTGMPEFAEIQRAVRTKLAAVDARVLEGLL